jgi:hypothetical protein
MYVYALSGSRHQDQFFCFVSRVVYRFRGAMNTRTIGETTAVPTDLDHTDQQTDKEGAGGREQTDRNK